MTDLTREGLVELAAKVEQASGPSRVLDGAITKALGEYPCWAPNQNERQPELFTDGKPGTRAREWLCPEFTASLDAAMKLIPDNADAAGERYRLEAYNSPGVLPSHVRASAWVAGAPRCYAANEALALCAAALKARARAMEAGRG